VSQIEGITATESVDGLYLVDSKGERLFRLNPTSKAIWSALSVPTRVDELCQGMITEFAGEERTIRRGVTDLLSNFQRVNLIRVSKDSQSPHS
jgi:hypothetical protein